MNQLGFQTLHAMMAISAPSATTAAKESLRKTLFGEKLSYSIPFHAFNQLGQAKENWLAVIYLFYTVFKDLFLK